MLALRMPSPRHVLLAAALAAASLLLAGLMGLRLVAALEEAQARVQRSVDLQLQAERLRTEIRGLGRAALDELMQRPRLAPELLAPWRLRIAAELGALQALAGDDAQRQALISALREALDTHLDALGALKRGDEAALAARRQRAAELEQRIAALQGAEGLGLRRSQEALTQRLRAQAGVMALLAVLALALALGAGWLLARLLSTQRRAASAQRRAEELRAAHQRTRFFAHQLLQVEEKERRALARELHDDFGQRLAALKLHLRLQARQAGDGEPLHQALLLVDECIAQVRQRAPALRPPQLDTLGLAAALRDHVATQARLAGVQAEVEIALNGRPADPDWDAHVFRIVQEALRNALTHAGATRVRLSLLGSAAGCALRLQDDGRGIAAGARQGLGLLHMRERTEMLGGRFDIETPPGGGTCVVCRWGPAPAPAAGPAVAARAAPPGPAAHTAIPWPRSDSRWA